MMHYIQTKSDIPMRLINLTQAIIQINDAVYQPSSHLSNTKHITSSERDILFELREDLISTSKIAQIRLGVNRDIDFDQERITDEHYQSLRNAHEEVLLKLSVIVAKLNKSLYSSNASEPFLQCVQEIKKLLLDSMKLMQIVNIQKHEFLNLHFKKNLIYQLCKLKGALFIPIAQDLDPLIGGFESNGKLEISEGNCGGKVISWIETCAKTTEISYPFYAGTNHSEYQQKQSNFKDHYTIISQHQTLNSFPKFITTHMKKNRLYYLSIQWKNSAHAIGIRIRQDDIIELFDPNYLHLFCYDKNVFQSTLGYLLTEYSLENIPLKYIVFEADVLQCNSTQSLFPHKTHIIQASNKSESEKNESIYIEMTRRLFLACNKNYKLDKSQQEQVFNIFIFNLKQIGDQIYFPAILVNLISHIQKISIESSFLLNEKNKDALLTILKDRLSLVSTAEYQSDLKARNNAIEDLVKMESKVTQELNQVRNEIDEENKNHLTSPIALTDKLILLTQKSLKLFRIFVKMKSSDAAVFLKNPDNNLTTSPSNFIVSWFRDKLKSTITDEKSSTALFQNYLEEEMNRLSARYSNSLAGKKTFQLNIAIEKLFHITRSLDKQTTSQDILNENQVHFVPDSFFKRNLTLFLRQLMLLQNDLRLAEDVDTIQKRLRKLTRLHDDQIYALFTPDDHLNDISYHISEVIKNFESDNDLKPRSQELSQTIVGIQKEMDTLLTSLQCMINYLEAVKEEYSAHTKRSGKTERTAMQILLQSKLRQRIDLLGFRIRSLIETKNLIITECRYKTNPDLFVERSSNIRKEYSDLFPIDFTLTENFSYILDRMVDRNKPIILNSEERLLIIDLENCFSYLYSTIEKLSEALIDLKKKIDKQQIDKHSNLSAHITLFNKKSVLQTHTKTLLQLKTQSEHMLLKEIDPQQIIDFVNLHLRPYINKENVFSITEFLKKETSNSEQTNFSIVSSTSTDEKKMKILSRKIKELVEHICGITPKIATEVLSIACIELSQTGLCLEKDYATIITKNLNSILQTITDKLSQDDITLLKRDVLALNYFFRGKVGINTEYTWFLLHLNQQDTQSNLEREQLGVRSFMLFKELCKDIEVKYSAERTDAQTKLSYNRPQF